MSKELKVSLGLGNVHIHETTIRTTMVFIAELQGERQYSPKRMSLPIYSEQKLMWIHQRTIGRMFCGVMRSK